MERRNQEQERDFKRKSADLALLMLKQRYSFLVCCFLLAASIYGLSRECCEHLNIHCLYEKIILDQSGCEKALQLVLARFPDPLAFGKASGSGNLAKPVHTMISYIASLKQDL